MNPEITTTFHRFVAFLPEQSATGKITKKKNVGMAYLQAGSNRYTLKLWSFIHERFYLIPSQKEAELYLVMTREENKKPNSRNKYLWNVVGNGRVNSVIGCLELEFDLLEKNIFLNLFPEPQAVAKNLPHPEWFDFVA